MGQLVGFLLHPPLSEIAKNLGKMLKYTPTFKVLSAPLALHQYFVYTDILFTLHRYFVYITPIFCILTLIFSVNKIIKTEVHEC